MYTLYLFVDKRDMGVGAIGNICTLKEIQLMRKNKKGMLEVKNFAI